jgi:hypothetical protein
MPNILIEYPPEFRCYAKFARKVERILQGIESPDLLYWHDASGLIEKFSEEHCNVFLSKYSPKNLPVEELTHAITFKPEDGLFQSLEVPEIPRRTIVIPITRVVNKDRGDDFDIYIGRGTKWGNPYAVGFGQAPGEEGDSRQEAIRKYAYDFERGLLGGASFMRELEKLQGKRLACHCKPLACHGDVLAAYLNSVDDGK